MILFNYMLLCMIFGTTFLFIKVGIDAGAPPFFSAGIRFFLAGLILFLFMVWKRKASMSLLLRKELFLTGIALTFGVFATLYWAEQYISSGIAAILSATSPFMIMLLQTSISRQKLSGITWAGCVIGFVGVIVLLIPGITFAFSRLWVAGCLAVLIGQVFYSTGAVYSRHVIQRFQDISPVTLNSVQMIHGGILLMVLSMFTEQVQIQSLLSPSAVSSLLYLIIVGSMMGHTIFYWLVAKTNPVFPSTWLYISPLIALALGVLLYNEPFSLLSLIGGITIIVGSVLINMSSLRELVNKRALSLRIKTSSQVDKIKQS